MKLEQWFIEGMKIAGTVLCVISLIGGVSTRDYVASILALACLYIISKIDIGDEDDD